MTTRRPTRLSIPRVQAVGGVAVDEHHAGAALFCAAAVARSKQAERSAQSSDQRHFAGQVYGYGRAVEVEFDHARCSLRSGSGPVPVVAENSGRRLVSLGYWAPQLLVS